MSHGGRGPPALGVGRVVSAPPSGAARAPAPSGSERRHRMRDGAQPSRESNGPVAVTRSARDLLAGPNTAPARIRLRRRRTGQEARMEDYVDPSYVS